MLPQDCSDSQQCCFSQLGFGCSRGQRSHQGLCKAGLHQCVFFYLCAFPNSFLSWVSLFQSSNSVSLPYRTQAPDLSMTSTVNSDLHSTPDLIEWANQNGFPKVTSYSEADLANRFVIKLRGGGKGGWNIIYIRCVRYCIPQCNAWRRFCAIWLFKMCCFRLEERKNVHLPKYTCLNVYFIRFFNFNTYL